MDGDEVIALVAACIVAGVTAARWYAALVTVSRRAAPARHRLILAVTPLACLMLVQRVLACCAAHEVQQAGEYDFLFLAGGGAWLGCATIGLLFVGLSARDDALETRNGAAVIAVCGAWAGVTLCYAGGNIGEGPTIWTTFVPAAVATAALFFLWLLFYTKQHRFFQIYCDYSIASVRAAAASPEPRSGAGDGAAARRPGPPPDRVQDPVHAEPGQPTPGLLDPVPWNVPALRPPGV